MKTRCIKSGATAAATLSLVLISGCGSHDTSAAPPPTVKLANPASVYCVELGGRLEIIRSQQGDRGLCHLPDGSVIDEWVLFRRDHSLE